MVTDCTWDGIRTAADMDESTRGALLEQYRGYLLLLAQRALSDQMRTRIDAEDLVQNTMLRATQGFPTFAGRTSQQFYQWLLAIHRNTITEELSRQHAAKRAPDREQSWQSADSMAIIYWLEPLDDQPTPSVRMMKDEQALQLARCLMLLPRDQSEAVRLRHLEGWSVEQIAQHFGKSIQATAGLIKRGLAHLRQLMPMD